MSATARFVRPRHARGIATSSELLEFLSAYTRSRDVTDLFAPVRTAGVEYFLAGGERIPRFVNEYWTSGQRKGHSLHEVSYRACFKPQLPAFFITRLTKLGDVVLDPFAGRGTTALEAALLGRVPVSNDASPLSRILTEPRLDPPTLAQVDSRLVELLADDGDVSPPDIDLSMFFHADTLREMCRLRDRLTDSPVDKWIRMIATNRLTGHSRGFFSVYTLPPNQAVSAEAQRKINRARNQQPDYRDVRDVIVAKSASLQRDLTADDRACLESVAERMRFLECDARHLGRVGADSVALTVTSPPFLDIVQYDKDNWLRCWFNRLDAKSLGARITMSKTVGDWSSVMLDVFKELERVTQPGAWIAFEVGEVRNGRVRLDEVVAPLGMEAGLTCVAVMVNKQVFTKTANCWGVKNNTKGTNTNRIVLFRKDDACRAMERSRGTLSRSRRRSRSRGKT